MPWSVKFILSAILLWVPLCGFTVAADQLSVEQWLEKMISASRNTDYEGTFVYLRGQQLQTMHVVHTSGPEGGSQKMTALNGPEREILITGHTVKYLLPSKHLHFDGAAYHFSPLPITLPQQIKHLRSHYQFLFLGYDRLAGLKSCVISIKPKDQWRFGYKLWLDSDNGLLLRSELLDEKGTIREQLAFTSIKVNAVKKIAPPPPPPKQSDIALKDSQWQFENLPAGFTEVAIQGIKKHTDNRKHLVLSDGLATVSVFLEPLIDGKEPLLEGSAKLGLLNAYGTVIHDHQALVVGEVPEATVKQIASSIRYQDTPSE